MGMDWVCKLRKKRQKHIQRPETNADMLTSEKDGQFNMAGALRGWKGHHQAPGSDLFLRLGMKAIQEICPGL